MTKYKYNEKGEDLIFYDDDKYCLIARDGNIMGTLTADWDLIGMALDHIEEEAAVLISKKDFCKIMDRFITQIEKIKREYPEESEIKKMYDKVNKNK